MDEILDLCVALCTGEAYFGLGIFSTKWIFSLCPFSLLVIYLV